MPPEPSPWDRKDFFKERKHERSSSEALGPTPSLSRWRDSSNNNNTTPYHHGGSSRWASADFRRPFGHGKQGGGGWHAFPEDSGTRGGDGKYGRNSSRENRAAALSGQKEWKGHSWETTASPNGNSHIHSDFVNSWDQLHLKEQNDKNGGGVGNNTGQRGVERGENSLGSLDWKTLKWTRSGSLSSRGSGFSHSSSSKSMGIDSVETKVEAALPSSVTPAQSPSGDAAAACVTSRALAEDNSSRKKPRLGWGEGLAKYEKKKVEGPEESAPSPKEPIVHNAVKDAMADCGVTNLETQHPNVTLAMEKSPSLTGLSECASPATPYSVACSSSPGIEEKTYSKTSSTCNGTSNRSASPRPSSINQSEGLPFNLENLELTQFVNLSSSLTELLQSDEQSFVDSGFVRSTAMNKLLVLKADISKTLEVTESEIDLLENELKSLVSDSGVACPVPAASTSLPAVCKGRPLEEQCAATDLVTRPSPLIVSSGDISVEKMDGALQEEHIEAKDEDIDSPGTATSKFVEPLCLRKDVIPSDAVRQSDGAVHLNSRSQNLEGEHSVCGAAEETTGFVSMVGDGTQSTSYPNFGTHATDVGLNYREDKLYDLILVSNKDFAKGATEVFSKLLPSNELPFDISRAVIVPSSQNDSQIEEKFAMRKRFLRFKERVLTLKFRAYQHLWKEDLRLLSIRRIRAKSQKKYELSARSLHNGYQKHRSSIRSRFSSPAGNLSLVPTSEVINYTKRLLSDSQVKPYRNTLKMPALILDKKERMASRFMSDNGLVEDPCAMEKERCVVNPWTSQETEIFLDKLTTFGKDFKKIASFLNHKTTADCVEFYYKNHKSESFQKTKKSEFTKQGKSSSTNTYLVTSGKRWNRETNATSLDMLGAVSEIAANVDDGLDNQQKCTSRFYVGVSSEYKIPRRADGILERSSSPEVFGDERETAAADVLAGICGSISSEAMSSCITSSVDLGDGCHQDWRCQKGGGSSKRHNLTPEVTQGVIDDETCSDESCGDEIDASDWTDEEKSNFIQAVASYGKDFAMIALCMRTRSRDQCKVFFSKARKCLGLDMIHPEPGSEGQMDANGGDGSDAEDACMVETEAVICENKVSGCKTEEHLQMDDLKLEITDTDPTGDVNLQPDLNQLEHKKDVEFRSEDLMPDDSEVEVKPEINLVTVSNTKEATLEPVSEVCETTEDANGNKAQERGDMGDVISGEAVSVDRNEHGLPSRSGSEVDTEAIKEVAVENSTVAIQRGKLLLPPGINLDSNISEVNGLNACPIGDSDSAHHSAGDRDTCLGVGIDHSAQMPCMDRDSCSQTSNSRSQDTVAVHHRKALSHDNTSSKLDFRKSNDRLCQKSASTDGYHQHLPLHSLLDCVESSQILRGYPVTLSTQNGMIKDVSCNESTSSLQSVSNVRNNLLTDRLSSRDCFLQKCSGPKGNGLMSELPFLTQEQTHSSSDVEKPCRSGDVKLFGQILTHPSSQPQQKPSCSSQDNEDKGAHHSKLNGGKSFNLRFGGNQTIDKNSFLPKFEQNNYLSVENNLPMRSYGFWDGSRIQTGFPSLPDSAILLAKYPAAFGKSPSSTSASKMELQPLHSVVKSSERGFNGVVFPTREVHSNSRVPEYQMYRSRDGTKLVQPYTVDQLRQEYLLSETQRRKDYELLASSIHQQRRGLVGINLVGAREGGVLVGGPCNGVSDPVAAIKMHYAKTEQYGGGIIREDEPWRSNGDIGSR